MRRMMLLMGVLVVVAGAGIAVLGASGSEQQSGSRAAKACAARWHVVARRGVPALEAVAALGSTNVWAVGSGNNRPVIVHWNGTKLTTQTFPWKGGSFSGVTARSGNDVWAVGGTDHELLAVHFDGHSWQRVQLPRVKGASLADVTAVAANDVWAVGSVAGDPGPRAVVMHWDGRLWRVVDLRGAAPRSELVSIDSVSADDVWAFGYAGPWNYGYGYSPIVLRWNGSRWTRVLFSKGEYKDWAYGALDIAPSGEVWMGVGEQSDAGGSPPVFVRWSGPTHKARRSYDVPIQGPNVLDIAAVSRDEVWAVGFTPAISHLDAKSKSWQAEPHPASPKDAALNAISAIAPTDIWAVGDHLIVRYSC